MSITLIIVAVTVLSSLYAFSNDAVKQKWMLNPYAVKRHNEYFRFITSGLIHQDYMHLLFNMVALYSFGEVVEQHFTREFPGAGKTLFAALYILGVVASDIPTYFKHQNQPYYNSLGASGGVSSIVFAAILLYPMMGMGLILIPIRLPAFIFGSLYMFYSYYQARRGGDYINHDAHLYGALFGIVFTFIAIPSSIPGFIGQIANWEGFF
jgi:membrane associated rhomboid family serine protease